MNHQMNYRVCVFVGGKKTVCSSRFEWMLGAHVYIHRNPAVSVQREAIFITKAPPDAKVDRRTKRGGKIEWFLFNLFKFPLNCFVISLECLDEAANAVKCNYIQCESAAESNGPGLIEKEVIQPSAPVRFSPERPELRDWAQITFEFICLSTADKPRLYLNSYRPVSWKLLSFFGRCLKASPHWIAGPQPLVYCSGAQAESEWMESPDAPSSRLERTFISYFLSMIAWRHFRASKRISQLWHKSCISVICHRLAVCE